MPDDDRKKLLKRVSHETGLAPDVCATVMRAYDAALADLRQAYFADFRNLTRQARKRYASGDQERF